MGAVIRGVLRLGIKKCMKVRTVKLLFYGRAQIENPGGENSETHRLQIGVNPPQVCRLQIRMFIEKRNSATKLCNFSAPMNLVEKMALVSNVATCCIKQPALP